MGGIKINIIAFLMCKTLEVWRNRGGSHMDTQLLPPSETWGVPLQNCSQMPGMAEEMAHTGSSLPTPTGSITLLILSFHSQYFVSRLAINES